MRTGAAAGHTGYFHEALYYADEEELLAVVVPFLRGGVAEGEPTVLAFGDEHATLVRSALPAADAGRVLFHPGGDMYARPASAIRSYRKMLAEYTAAGAGQIRIIGELPPIALGATWDWWARYESAINTAYDEFPLWSMCAYDTTTTPPAVLEDVARTHPRSAAPGELHLPSTPYLEPPVFLSRQRPGDPDPLQLTEPILSQVDPDPAAVRAALTNLNRAPAGPVLDEVGLADLLMAATEVLVNAQLHGVSPVRLHCWVGEDRIVVVVTDQGKGPTDPFAGLQPAAHAPVGGLGLWLAHQTCDHVALYRDDGQFTVRLISGNPHHRVAEQNRISAAEPA
ncbi:sensor histidine kinase [Actinophytocola xanthii]|uniref:Transcriptional regulator n=1 Tax=Actinophytocola xanthii TaxID=1912961 RepID=A0A1Q8CUT0_9PSEU|nr:sensor histidine kinase [Actinophytocola xanthii]OLF18121.1 transcriptional regulator [Actinophytocola xanthii]